MLAPALALAAVGTTGVLLADGRTGWLVVAAALVVMLVLIAALVARGRRDESAGLLDEALRSAPVGFAYIDRELCYQSVNPALAAINGVRAEMHAGRTVREVIPQLAAVVEPLLERVLTTGSAVTDVELEGEGLTGDGRRRYWRASYYPIRGAGGSVTGVGAMVAEITERRRLEEELAQAQKMETVGRLAGGIAHDFNNLLTVIKAYSDLLLADMAEGDERRDEVREIQLAANRAAMLTRQLLAFSRKQVLRPRPIDLNVVLRGLEPMLRKLMIEDIELDLRLSPDLGLARADPGQMEQVLMNLVINAADAMPSGGRLTIRTQALTVGGSSPRTDGAVAPGRYAVIEVADTGSGMDPLTLSRIFEPFFTTKGPGKGTGLGLSTAYGIVKQTGGDITVESEAGRGTTFRVYLAATAEPGTAESRAAVGGAMTGRETILLVDDEEALRGPMARALRAHGYEVLEAESAGDALEIAVRHEGEIHLILSDLIMPDLGGRELASRIRASRPEASAMFMSGFKEEVVRRGMLAADQPLIEKPFAVHDLLLKVREVLDGKRGRGE
ncbi:MAG: ATP-binding protein [Gemmatimonadaceae bacterium]